MRVASWLLSLFLVTCTAYSQQPAVAPPNSDAAGSPTEPSLHNDAKLLVQLMGVRQRMTDGRDKSVQAGKDAMVKNSPTINPAFVEEWGKRMAARTNVEDYVNLFVLVYEKHFNDAEINELIQVQRDVKDSKTPHVSAHLQEKLNADSVTVQSEILGGCAQIGAKLGGEIAQEIAKEHPGWVPTATAPK